MKRFSVSLDVISLLESMPECFSDAGIDLERLSSRKLRDGTLWRLESDFGDSPSIAESIEVLFAMVSPAKVRGPGIRAYLAIAVYYDTATCSVEIPRECIAMLQGSEITIEITCYPTSDQESNISRSH